MESIGVVLMIVGYCAAIVGYFWSLGIIFRENPILGVLCVLIPLALLIVLWRRLPQTWRPLLLLVCGSAVAIYGMTLWYPGK